MQQKMVDEIIKVSKISKHIFISDGFSVKIRADLQTILDFVSIELD